jgi:hypothetical protein
MATPEKKFKAPEHRNPLIGDTPSGTAENVLAVLEYLQIAEASIGGTCEIDDTIISGRARILNIVQDAVAALGEPSHD